MGRSTSALSGFQTLSGGPHLAGWTFTTSGFPANTVNVGDCRPHSGVNRYGRLWPVLSGERGEYELANGRPASVYLRSMADATNDGYFVPEQIWDRSDVACFTRGQPTGSASPLNWAEGQYLRLP